MAPGAEIQKTEQMKTDIDGGHGNAERCEKLQHRRGEKGDPEHRHRPLLEVLRIGAETLRRQIDGFERADRFQPAQAIKQEGIHIARLGKLLFTGGLRLPADERHEKRDGWHGEQQHQRRDPGKWQDRQHENQGNDGGLHPRRLETGKIGHQRFRRLSHDARRLTRGGARQIERGNLRHSLQRFQPPLRQHRAGGTKRQPRRHLF
ncbi:hypothetical protein D3C72_610510 [compost metagenome]